MALASPLRLPGRLSATLAATTAIVFAACGPAHLAAAASFRPPDLVGTFTLEETIDPRTPPPDPPLPLRRRLPPPFPPSRVPLPPPATITPPLCSAPTPAPTPHSPVQHTHDGSAHRPRRAPPQLHPQPRGGRVQQPPPPCVWTRRAHPSRASPLTTRCPLRPLGAPRVCCTLWCGSCSLPRGAARLCPPCRHTPCLRGWGQGGRPHPPASRVPRYAPFLKTFSVSRRGRCYTAAKERRSPRPPVGAEPEIGRRAHQVDSCWLWVTPPLVNTDQCTQVIGSAPTSSSPRASSGAHYAVLHTNHPLPPTFPPPITFPSPPM